MHAVAMCTCPRYQDRSTLLDIQRNHKQQQSAIAELAGLRKSLPWRPRLREVALPLLGTHAAPPCVPGLGPGPVGARMLAPTFLHAQNVRSNVRYWIASAMCLGWIAAALSRSAIVRATFRMRSCARAVIPCWVMARSSSRSHSADSSHEVRICRGAIWALQ